MLGPQPFEHPLCRVALLAMHIPVAVKPGVDDPGEGIQLRPPHRRLSPVARRNRPERVKVDDYCAARSGLILPLPWQTLSPPF